MVSWGKIEGPARLLLHAFDDRRLPVPGRHRGKGRCEVFHGQPRVDGRQHVLAGSPLDFDECASQRLVPARDVGEAGFEREWPPVVAMTPAVREAVARKWSGLLSRLEAGR